MSESSGSGNIHLSTILDVAILKDLLSIVRDDFGGLRTAWNGPLEDCSYEFVGTFQRYSSLKPSRVGAIEAPELREEDGVIGCFQEEGDGQGSTL